MTDEQSLEERIDAAQPDVESVAPDENAPAAEAPATAHTDSAGSDDQLPPQYGVGPFSIREVSIIGAWLVAFVSSFFSVTVFAFASVWTLGIVWILMIGVPTVAVFLLALRRLSPQGIRRVGSLGIDQFASVAFSVSATVWFAWIWDAFRTLSVQGGAWVSSWVVFVCFAAMLAGVVLTVFAPFIPPFSEDFRGRPEVVAHRSARPIRPVTARPARPVAEIAYVQPAGSTDPGAYGATGAYGQPAAYGEPAAYGQPGEYADTGAYSFADPEAAHTAYSGSDEQAPADGEPIIEAPVAAEPRVEEAPAVRYQAFWALAPVERDVVDEQGIPLFRIGPMAWALVIEDRGDTFVVRDEDGTVGFLHDVSEVTRG
ncbi:hypothetical protein AB1K54_09990 [Microbacterium sp. BWT-B31]|uniref:hypothetical protein n=1 Tax=Microbacterium sp. BWT-B31 TaxID=3232072 RepID=UPI0035271F35